MSRITVSNPKGVMCDVYAGEQGLLHECTIAVIQETA